MVVLKKTLWHVQRYHPPMRMNVLSKYLADLTVFAV